VGDLVSILTHRHVDGGVVERQGEMGITTAPMVRRLRRDRPSLPILLYCRLDGTTARSIVALARAGVDDLILPDQGDIGLQLRQRFFVAGMARGAEQVLSELASLLPPTVEPIVAYCLRHAHAPLTVGQIAGALGVHRRTLVNRLATTAMPSPAAIISWARLMLAAHLLQERGRSVESVALALGFGSGAALRNMLRRHAGVAPSELPAHGGWRFVVERFARTIGRSSARPDGVAM
jgi:AraC-like DNA-binding protein